MAEVLSARDVLDRLVAFPTVSSETNLDLIDWVEDYLGSHGVTGRRVWNEDGTKAAFYANVGPEEEGGILLSGHTDVVPVDGQDWTSDPFIVTERDGRLYGRGTADMKGFVATAIAAVPRALASDLARPLQLAFSYDEEVGCTGAPPMIDDLVGHLPRAAAAVIGEPSMLKPVTGHKGSLGFNVRFRGHEVHSSMAHRGVSAVMEAARLIHWANQMNARNREGAPDLAAAAFEPSWTSLHVGQIEGGTAHNIMAGECRFLIDFRVVPGDDMKGWEQAMMDEVARIDAGMKAVHPGAGIDIEPAFDVPGLVPETEGFAETLVRRVTGENGTHVVSYGTEAGQFQERGYSSVICGPGDIAQAHQADEFISAAQFEAGQRFVSQLIETLRT